MALNFAQVRADLNTFDFRALFTETLGWSQPPNRRGEVLEVEDTTFTLTQVAELGGVMVLEATASGEGMPDAKIRRALHKQVGERYLENLLIFVDEARTQSLWAYAKREGGKTVYRDHPFIKGQPGDLFIGKLSGIIFDVKDFDAEGNVSVVEVAARLKNALDVERTTKKFYAEFQQQHVAFVELIEGIPDERARRWYASVLLNRLMFVFFLQRKGFVDGGKYNYLSDKLGLIKRQGKNYYADFLHPLFFEGFAKPAEYRTAEARGLLGDIKYLNGGLFLEHRIEQDNSNIVIPNEAFDNLLGLFLRYSWNLNDLPGENDDEINPDVLGYIFEKYINQKAFGAYYTRPEITEYLCEQTINRLVLEAVNVSLVVPNSSGLPQRKHFESVADLLLNLDAPLCRQLLLETLPKLSLLDPACGSGAFLVAALKTLINIYSAVVGKIEFLNDATLKGWLARARADHPSLSYFIKKRIITDNLYGVDLMEEATDIAKLRLFLALVASAETVAQLEPLPNIDFNILPGNSLVGLTRVDPNEFDKQDGKGNVQTAIFGSPYQLTVDEVNRLIDAYKENDAYQGDQTQAREDIRTLKRKANDTLDGLLLDKFKAQKIQFEGATWDDAKNKAGKPQKRALNTDDVQGLKPFHWGFEFHKVLTERGGFDAIITNPPWDILKPNAKEFFGEHSELITKKKMDIKAFEKAQAELLRDAEVKRAWLAYLSGFPHQSAYFRTSPGYANQISVVNGKKAGGDINLYKLFTEQCFNLLRDGGQCGIVIPSGIYTDLGAKQLREMLFTKTQITSLFGLSNEKYVFENVHHAFKVCLLTFQKDAVSETFTAAFRINPREAVSVEKLDNFLHNPQEHVEISVPLVRRLSPDSLSVMEFKNDVDVQIAEKMLKFPLLGEQLEDTWNLKLTREFDMTNDSHLFKPEPGPGRLPLFEGKMIWHFSHELSSPRFWVDERQGRKADLGRAEDEGQALNYQDYRLGIRAIASSTNERSLIASVLPVNVFCGNSILSSVQGFDKDELLFLVGVLDSFVLDAFLRSKVTTNINMFYIYQLPIPRLTSSSPAFSPIVTRAAKLICTTPEYDDLAAGVGLGSSQNGVTDPEQRAALRAELDGLVAHLYGLSEDEFAYILTTFPLVDESIKTAALTAFNHFAPTSDDTDTASEIARLIAAGESEGLEFKSTARVNLHTGAADKKMEEVILKTVAGFWNADGGTLLVGVSDDGAVLGLNADLQTLGKKKDLDGLELFLTDLLLSQRLGLSGLVRVTFHDVAGRTVCKIAVEAASEPVWVAVGGVERLFVRTGNSTRDLSGSEAFRYAQRHWGQLPD